MTNVPFMKSRLSKIFVCVRACMHACMCVHVCILKEKPTDLGMGIWMGPKSSSKTSSTLRLAKFTPHLFEGEFRGLWQIPESADPQRPQEPNHVCLPAWKTPCKPLHRDPVKEPDSTEMQLSVSGLSTLSLQHVSSWSCVESLSGGPTDGELLLIKFSESSGSWCPLVITPLALALIPLDGQLEPFPWLIQ